MPRETTPREVFLPFRFPASPPAISRVRSTLLTASINGIRQAGREARYLAALPAELHLEMQMLTAGAWVPLDLAVQHYTACDRMGLSTSEMDRMGTQVSLRTQKTFVGTLGSVAAGAGATPWNVFAHTPRIWDRIFEGGDQCVYKVGPKDALTVLVGCPLLRIPYFRVAIRSYYAALAHLLVRTMHSHEVVEHRSDSSIGMRFSWV
jgi:hypothetical protein